MLDASIANVAGIDDRREEVDGSRFASKRTPQLQEHVLLLMRICVHHLSSYVRNLQRGQWPELSFVGDLAERFLFAGSIQGTIVQIEDSLHMNVRHFHVTGNVCVHCFRRIDQGISVVDFENHFSGFLRNAENTVGLEARA